METVWRVAAVYLFLMVALRTVGKRDIGQLAPFDLVILLLIPEIVAAALVGADYSLTNGFVGVSTLLVLVFLTSVATHLSPTMDRIIDGTPTVLIHRGRLMESTMNLERIAPAEIFTQMHASGLEHLSQVKWGILERDGKISFIPYDPEDANDDQTDDGPVP